jgi:hypothetical protein
MLFWTLPMDCARCMSVQKAKRWKNYQDLYQKWKIPPELLTPTEPQPQLKIRDGTEGMLEKVFFVHFYIR